MVTITPQITPHIKVEQDQGEGATQIRNLSLMMELGRMARRATTKEELGFIIVNQTRKLINYTQAALLLFDEEASPFARVLTISGIAVVDRDVPMAVWLKKVVRAMAAESPGVRRTTPIQEKYLTRGGYEDWQKFTSPNLLWVPLFFNDGRMIGGIIFMRETPFAEHEVGILDGLSESYGHALGTSLFTRRRKMSWNTKKRIVWSAVAMAVLAMLMPVRMSTLAPVAVEPYKPRMVAAPIDGVIADIAVTPNSYVRSGELLFTFDDTRARNSYEAAVQNLQLAKAKRDRARQGAFRDDTSKREISVLESEVRLRETELLYAKEIMEKLKVRSEKDGLILFDDPKALIGRPVKIGERIMMIADPTAVQAKVKLAVGDSIVLKPNAPIRLFLDVNPLDPLSAHLKYASYEASPTPEGKLVYSVTADFDDGEALPRIGLQGTAKIYGERTTLFFYLFRKPIAIFRKTLGF